MAIKIGLDSLRFILRLTNKPYFGAINHICSSQTSEKLLLINSSTEAQFKAENFITPWKHMINPVAVGTEAAFTNLKMIFKSFINVLTSNLSLCDSKLIR